MNDDVPSLALIAATSDWTESADHNSSAVLTLSNLRLCIALLGEKHEKSRSVTRETS